MSAHSGTASVCQRTCATRGALGTSWVLLAGVLLGGGGVARGDGASGPRSTDAVAKEREDQFNDLKKKDTSEAANQRLKILDSLQFAPCPTAQRFLLGLLKKPSAPGDERFFALLSPVKIADAQALEEVVAALQQAKDATLWQGFGEALADRLSEPVRAWLKGPALDSPQPETLCACLEAFSRRPEPAQAARIAALYAKSAKSPARADVAFRALRALARTQGAAARTALLEGAKSPHAQVRLAAADAIPALEPFDAEAEAAVRALFQDENASVQRTAVTQAGLSKRASLAPALVQLLGDPRARTRHVVATALAQITGQALGQDARAWAAWLQKKDPGKPETLTVPTYHGLPVESDRVVFLVDASSSMTWPWSKPTHRIDVARSELAAVLKTLPADTLFNVLVFSNKVSAWKKVQSAASPENVAAALAWAEKAMAEPSGDTHLYEALEAAFSNDPQFDTIFLLTDGNPTAGRYWSNEALLATVRAFTVYRRAAIHTIGLSLAEEDLGRPNLTEDLKVMSALLAAMAGATSGEFREVRRVPAPK